MKRTEAHALFQMLAGSACVRKPRHRKGRHLMSRRFFRVLSSYSSSPSSLLVRISAQRIEDSAPLCSSVHAAADEGKQISWNIIHCVYTYRVTRPSRDARVCYKNTLSGQSRGNFDPNSIAHRLPKHVSEMLVYNGPINEMK